MRTRAIALLIALLGSGRMASGQDAREILRHSSDVYASLRTYEFEAVDQMSFEIDGVKYRLNVHYGAARGDTPNLALTREVRAAAYEEPIGNGAQHPNLSVDFPYDLSRFAENVKSAKILREEELTENGKNASCYVVEVFHTPTENDLLRHVDPPAETIWINKASYLAIRLAYKSTQVATSSQPAFDIAHVVNLGSYKLNGEPPAWLVSANAGFANQTAKRRLAKVGKPAPDFKIHDLNGSELTLSSQRGKVVLLEFWAIWCAPCRAQIPISLKLEHDWGAKGLVIVRLTDEKAEDVIAFQKDTNRKFRAFVDAGEVLRQYQIYARPVTIIIDKMGVISAYDEELLNEGDLLDRLKRAGLK